MATVKDLAELLGVEILEEFEITNETMKFRFTDRQLEVWCYNKWIPVNQMSFIFDILNGDRKIVKKSWKPKIGDRFYAVSIVRNTIVRDIWQGTTSDYGYYVTGNCFRTEEDAEKHKEEVINHLKSTYDNGRYEIRED